MDWYLFPMDWHTMGVTVTQRLIKNNVDLDNNPAGDVLEHHTVAGFVGCLSSGSWSSHKLLLKLVLVQGGEVCQTLFTGCQNTRHPRRVRSWQYSRRPPPYEPAGHTVHTADERDKPWHLFKWAKYCFSNGTVSYTALYATKQRHVDSFNLYLYNHYPYRYYSYYMLFLYLGLRPR